MYCIQFMVSHTPLPPRLDGNPGIVPGVCYNNNNDENERVENSRQKDPQVARTLRQEQAWVLQAREASVAGGEDKRVVWCG
jgi:hypothetical protein